MKFKKIMIFFLISIFAFSGIVLADDEIEEFDENIMSEIEAEAVLETAAKNMKEPETYSKHIICMERSTGEVLYEKDAYTQTAMASTTKILTCIIALENCDMTETVEISSKAAHTGGSTLGISAGSTMTMESLIYGLMLRSGNDCAVAIAEHIGGSIEEFAEIMNEKAKALGLVNSHFVTPHGLDNDDHYSTAYDMAILTNYALNNDKFREIVGVKTTTIMIGNSPRTISNTNELLGNVDGVYGVKTGFTGNAGRCLITSCRKGNLDIIIVVLGADTKKIRGLDTRNIITYIFANYEMVDTYDLVKEAFDNFCKNKNITVKKSLSTTELMIRDKESYVYPINKNEIKNLKTAIYSVIRNRYYCKKWFKNRSSKFKM